MASRSSEQVDIQDVSADNVDMVIDAATETSVEAVNQNDKETHFTQMSSNMVHNEETLLIALGTDGSDSDHCLKIMSSENINELLDVDDHDDCRMLNVDNQMCSSLNVDDDSRILNVHNQMCSSLNVETVTESCEEKDLLQLCPDEPNCLQDTSYTSNASNADSAFSLPDFNRLYDDDGDDGDDYTKSVLDNEPISCDSDNVRPSSSSQIPYFEKCSAHNGDDLLSFSPTTNGVAEAVLEEKSLIELMKEIREDLTGDRNKPETDIGLERLFEDVADNAKSNSLQTKSKSAKKRKKQQLRLKKLTTPTVPSSRRAKFAQNFDELKRSCIDYEDHNLDSSITCPVCLDLYHLPSICQPCGHMFCDLCLRRLTALGTEGIPCPLCRAVIASCELNREFDENLLLNYPDIYTARAMSERHSKYRHNLLPFTPPVPLRKRIMRQLIATRNQQSDLRWMSHDSFKFLLGCTVGLFIASLVMLYSKVTSVNEARDVNVVFLSVLLGATVTYLVFKFVKI